MALNGDFSASRYAVAQDLTTLLPTASATRGLFPDAIAKQLRAAERGVEPGSTRTKIWQLDSSLHCSIMGTCLSTGELRALLRKFKATTDENPSDHDLHGLAVSTVGTRSPLAKQFQKALDRRHGPAIRRFAKASSSDELFQLWEEARRSGDIPGAYWATLTHPAATDALVRRVFGDVHMLSHLVGAANRADIRRLHAIEEEKSALEEKLARQQAKLRDEVVARDARIRELNAMLAARVEERAAGTEGTDVVPGEVETLNALVVDLRKALDTEVRRRERAERRASELAADREAAEQQHVAMAQELEMLRGELRAIEAQHASLAETGEREEALDLHGLTILYVGGRPHQIVRLRALVESASGRFLHHDGGVEERKDLLAGLVSTADVAVFPVDCVSHDAVLSVKRLCRQAAKPFIPLRSVGIASLLQGLRSLQGNNVLLSSA